VAALFLFQTITKKMDYDLAVEICNKIEIGSTKDDVINIVTTLEGRHNLDIPNIGAVGSGLCRCWLQVENDIIK